MWAAVALFIELCSTLSNWTWIKVKEWMSRAVKRSDNPLFIDSSSKIVLDWVSVADNEIE